MEAFTAVSLPATDEGAEDGLSACAVLSSGKASEVLGMPLEEAAVAAGFEAEYPFSFFSVFSAVFFIGRPRFLVGEDSVGMTSGGASLTRKGCNFRRRFQELFFRFGFLLISSSFI